MWLGVAFTPVRQLVDSMNTPAGEARVLGVEFVAVALQLKVPAFVA
jgi:hypothetical protein